MLRVQLVALYYIFRYFAQAEQQLPEGLWQLMKSDFGNTPTLSQFLKQNPQSQGGQTVT